MIKMAQNAGLLGLSVVHVHCPRLPGAVPSPEGKQGALSAALLSTRTGKWGTVEATAVSSPSSVGTVSCLCPALSSLPALTTL